MRLPPYYPNPDGMHCWQCCLKMAIGHFEPGKTHTIEQLDIFSGKVEGLWTWPTRSCLWLGEEGYDVSLVGLFDMDAFIAAPEEYMIAFFGRAAAEEAIRFSDIPKEVEDARAFVASPVGKYPKRGATLEDVRAHLDDGWLVIVWCDQSVLRGTDKFSGHFLLVYAHDGDDFLLHNPDSVTDNPAEGAQNRVSAALLEKAGWIDRGKGDITALRLKERAVR